MEPSTRFDLENAIRSWRQRLVEELPAGGDTISELEEHLRTALADLGQRGLSEEESFLIAFRRLGSPTALAGEFGQSDPAAVWRRRVFWILVGWVAAHLWGSIANLARFSVANLAQKIPVQFVNAFVISVYFLIGMIPLVVAIQLARGRWKSGLNRWVPMVATRLRAAAVVIIAGIAIDALFQWAIISTSRPHFYGYNNWHAFGMSFLFGVSGYIPAGLILAWLMPIPPKQRPVAG